MKRVCLPESIPSLHFPNFPEQAIAPWAASNWAKQQNAVIFILDESLARAEEKGEDLTAIQKSLFKDLTVEFYLWDKAPSPDHPEAFEKECDRIALLSKLLSIKSSPQSGKKSLTIISATPESILAPCPRPENISDNEVELSSGKSINFETFAKLLGETLDYSSEVICEEPGQFAVRGGIIDVYPVNANFPARIDFFGNEIEEIRAFDPTTQRTVSTINEIKISSNATNIGDGRKGEFINYLPDRVDWVINEPQNMLGHYPLLFHEPENKKIDQINFSLIWERDNGQNDYYSGFSELPVGTGIFSESKICNLSIDAFVEPLQTSPNDWFKNHQQEDSRNEIIRKIKNFQKKGYGLILSVGADAEKKRVFDILKNNYPEINPPKSVIKSGQRDGFIYHTKKSENSFDFLQLQGVEAGFIFLTAREFLGRERSRRPQISNKARVQRKEVDQSLDFSELVDGDYLVHHQHGICRFCHLGKVGQGTEIEEAISLEFADGLLLHVPLQESHLLSRYIGLQKAKPKLAKLGGKSWARVRQAAEMAALDLAADLLRLQALRDSEKGFAFAPDDQWQKDFEDSFPFSETADQLLAIEAVKLDMECEKPMDRLICGDVGFGKTEVAMRAAFKAVMSGKQVAILSPTTILCQQHYNSFRDRMLDFPVTIEMISRFRTKGEQKKIVEGIASGGVDILIGTHRLFSDDLKFHDLGLLIIDEEQRFGVEHKEKLKKIRANIDILTLSATPIPRTLYFAMVGARSFSTIDTPPTNRRSIRTEVQKNTTNVVTKAVETEVRRGGQVFYLHNRVKTIHSVAKKLNLMNPNWRIGVGHGQMPESELERIMTDFVAGGYDILVCTTIIESGLDIPNCNTIIIDGADKFGLSQLYQLRGRVGRFNRQAYAYLLVNEANPISNKAKKRLSALRQTNQLGAGLRIALRDLELRGAGNLLGSEQSGHVAGVGFEMYCNLLKESVARLKGDEVALRIKAVVKLDFLCSSDSNDALDSSRIRSIIPSSYIGEARLRIEVYRKLSLIDTQEGLDQLSMEVEDRFGKLPEETVVLFMETEVRLLAESAGFDLITSSGNQLLCRFPKKPNDPSVKYLRKAGQIPVFTENEPFLKLKETIRFLKIYLHGKKRII